MRVGLRFQKSSPRRFYSIALPLPVFVGLLLVARIVRSPWLRISGVETPPAARTNLGRVRKRPGSDNSPSGNSEGSRRKVSLQGASLGRDTRPELTIPLTPSAQRPLGSYRRPHTAAIFRWRSTCVQCKECPRVLIATRHLVARDGIEPPTPCAASGCPCTS